MMYMYINPAIADEILRRRKEQEIQKPLYVPEPDYYRTPEESEPTESEKGDVDFEVIFDL